MTGAHLETSTYRIGFMPPLRSRLTGESFEWLPCMDNPAARDADASIEEQRAAARICRTECPALSECGARARELGEQATGVWAGHLSLRSRRKADVEDAADPVVVAWAADAGVTLPLDRGSV